MRLDIFNGFESVTMIFDFKSFSFKRCYRGVGEFTLELDSLSESASLQQDYFMIVGTDTFIIENRHKYKNAKNEIIFELSGQHINSILGRRVITGLIINTSDTIENQLYRLVRDNFISPSDIHRVIPGFCNAAGRGLTKKATTSYTLENMSVLEVLNTVCGNSDLGYQVNFYPELGKFEFEVLAGRDLSDDVFFGDEFSNVTESEIYENKQGYVNVGYLNNEGVITTAGSATGLDRREFIQTGTDIMAVTDALKENEPKVNAEGVVISNDQFMYRVDWNLGDSVSFLDKTIGFIVEKPILEIEEVYTETVEINVTFGDKIPTVFDVLKRR